MYNADVTKSENVTVVFLIHIKTIGRSDCQNFKISKTGVSLLSR